MKTITVKVTQKHIDEGKIDFLQCPLALAIQDAGFKSAAVRFTVWEKVYGATRTLPLTRGAIRFRQRFDDGKPVKPATFRLALD